MISNPAGEPQFLQYTRSGFSLRAAGRMGTACGCAGCGIACGCAGCGGCAPADASGVPQYSQTLHPSLFSAIQFGQIIFMFILRSAQPQLLRCQHQYPLTYSNASSTEYPSMSAS